MLNDDENTTDADRATYIQDLAEHPYGRPAGRYMRQAMAADGMEPTPYMANFVAQRTVAALPAWQQAPFRDDPITDAEVQRWWANWDAATMRMTLPHFVLHDRRQRRPSQLGNEHDAAYARGDEVDVHHASQPRTGRPAQKTRLVGNRPSLLRPWFQDQHCG